MKIRHIVIVAGVILLTYGFIGYLMLDANRDQFIIFSDTREDATYTNSLELEGNHSYEIYVTLAAEAWIGTVIVRGYASITVNGTLVAEEDLYDRNDDDEDDTDARDSVSYFFTPMGTTNVTLYGEMEEGHNWDVRVYQDAPEFFSPEMMFYTDLSLFGTSIFIIGAILELYYIVKNLQSTSESIEDENPRDRTNTES